MSDMKKNWLSEADGCFRVAGFTDVIFKEIPNQYCGPTGCSICAQHPWLLVGTKIGIFKFGWRKRVIALEWDQTVISEDAEKLFAGEDTTKYGKGIHCWGYVKAVEYLTALRRAAGAV